MIEQLKEILSNKIDHQINIWYDLYWRNNQINKVYYDKDDIVVSMGGYDVRLEFLIPELQEYILKSVTNMFWYIVSKKSSPIWLDGNFKGEDKRYYKEALMVHTPEGVQYFTNGTCIVPCKEVEIYNAIPDWKFNSGRWIVHDIGTTRSGVWLYNSPSPLFVALEKITIGNYTGIPVQRFGKNQYIFIDKKPNQHNQGLLFCTREDNLDDLTIVREIPSKSGKSTLRWVIKWY